MSEMNTDDMDDLLQKAGEKYPLRTDNSDWEAVSAKLGESNPSIFTLPAVSKKSDGKKKYYPLVAFFVLVLVGYYSVFRTGHISDSLSHNQISSQKPANENNPEESSDINNAGNSKGYNKINGQGSAKGNPGALNVLPAPVTDHNNLLSSNTEANNRKAYTTVSQIKEYHSELGLDKPELNNAGEIGTSPVFNILKSKQTELKGGNAQQTETPISVSKRSRSKFYFGIMLAPDISMVKFQSVKGIGFGAGLLAGYKISKKLNIETGVQFDIKDYYSEGEYFDKQNIPNLDYSSLININGNCKMIEVPLNIRYNLRQTRKNDWFITTGFSTYFMFRESYDYNYMHYGITKAGYYATTKPSQYWFSVFNISIGYEHQIGRIGSLRVEPYLKSPLTGMGTGSLPIMSTGVNLGIIHGF